MTQRRGWCPSLFEPMATGDGLLVRVKPPGGVLAADAARLVADAAARHGNGAIELTGRASLQCRGFTTRSAAAFADAIVQAGLASADRAAERRRSVIAAPLAGGDPAGVVIAALETALERDTTLERLPAKFGFLVDGGALGLADVQADINLRVVGERCKVSLDGGAEVARIATAEAAPAALRLAHAFLALAGEERRMRALVGAMGEAAIFAAAGLARSPASPRLSGRPTSIGWIEAGAFGVGVPFGSASGPVLAALADLAERFGDGALRLTPWRAVILAGVARSDIATLRAALEPLDLIVDPEDPRLRVSACPGQPGCAAATVATRALAAALRPKRGVSVHVSGCEKGCAHPGPAAITLVGREGAFDLVRRGRAGDAPVRRGLCEAEARAL